MNSVITGSGSYIPSRRVKNSDFSNHVFYEKDGKKLDKQNDEIIEKFRAISTINERRYVNDDQVTSDIAYEAAMKAISSSNTDKESLDYIIVAHNFGDVPSGNRRSDMVPAIAARVKHKLAIDNPGTVAYDVIFGCPGWLQAMIQAHYYISSGIAKKILVIGAEILSRVSDPHDRDSMLYADGAGATILEARDEGSKSGILSHSSRSDTKLYSEMLSMGPSYDPDYKEKDQLFLKMNGRKLYQYALEHVPMAIKECLEDAKVTISEVKKILIHQANGKMDAAILQRLYALCGEKNIPDDIMPMTVDWLGNSSVATLPTLLDLMLRKDLKGQEINKGDALIFASVGAGMNINAFIYRV